MKTGSVCAFPKEFEHLWRETFGRLREGSEGEGGGVIKPGSSKICFWALFVTLITFLTSVFEVKHYGGLRQVWLSKDGS